MQTWSQSANLYQVSVKSTPRISLVPQPFHMYEKEDVLFSAIFIVTWGGLAPQSESSNQILECIIICA